MFLLLLEEMKQSGKIPALASLTWSVKVSEKVSVVAVTRAFNLSAANGDFAAA